MKFNFSLSLKLTLIVVSISAAVIFTLTYVNIKEQASFFEDAYLEKAVVIVQSLDTNIGQRDELRDKETLQDYISNFSKINPEILQISINIPDEEGLKVVVSSDEDSIGSNSSSYNYLSFEEIAIVNIPNHTGNTHTLTVIAPINLSGQIAGTYEILLSMDKAYTAFDVQARNLVMMSTASLFILIFSFLFLLRKVIVKPITEVRDAAKRVSEGDLNTEIKIRSRDELGDLSAAFNQMTIDLKKSRAETKRYSTTLEKLLCQKDEFVNQLGHDLKNPLLPLINLVPELEKNLQDQESKEIFEIVNRNLGYIRNLVIKTLALARINNTDTVFSIENINLFEEVNSVIERNRSIFTENNIVVKSRIKKDLKVKADKLQIGELFDNLLSNAVKYSPNGGTITIDANDDGNLVTVSVKDLGMGMSKEQLSHVFEEFYKVDKSRHDFTSSGLGLTICKRIIEKHGGKIWAESPGLGKGTTMFFTIPK